MTTDTRAPARAGASGTAAAPTARLGLVRQLLRFGLAGAVAGITDYSSLQLLTRAGLLSELAKAISFVLGSTVGYAINSNWTFAARRDAREVVSVTGAYGLAFCLNVSAYAALRYSLPEMPWKITLCWFLAQALATSCNFAVQRGLIFRRGRRAGRTARS
ncbi:GtrA family protein [Salinifilum ghardaiensis]